MNPVIVSGDLLEQDVEVIVNAWNRNIIPWWLLLPQGVSGAIKKRGGTEPFRQVAKHGPIALGEAVLTGAGRLPFRGIIHVAGINMLWRASEASSRGGVRSAMKIVEENSFASVAFPVLGTGSGGFDTARALGLINRRTRRDFWFSLIVGAMRQETGKQKSDGRRAPPNLPAPNLSSPNPPLPAGAARLWHVGALAYLASALLVWGVLLALWVGGQGGRDRTGDVLGPDFPAFYTAGWMLRHGETARLYDFERQRKCSAA